MKTTSKEIYNKLLHDDKILELKGQIKFFLGDVDIIVKQKDVVGNIIQEWLEGWLKKNQIEYAPNPNTQMPPDFFLSPNDETKNLLEIKAFNRSASPGFDIADFRMYEEEIIEKPFMHKSRKRRLKKLLLCKRREASYVVCGLFDFWL